MSDVVVTYTFRPKKGIKPELAAQAIGLEGTIGTWTPLTTRTDYVVHFEGTVENVSTTDGGFLTRIHYPSEAFDPGNIAQYLSLMAGNLFGLTQVDAVRLTEIEFPDDLVPFRGPKF